MYKQTAWNKFAFISVIHPDSNSPVNDDIAPSLDVLLILFMTIENCFWRRYKLCHRFHRTFIGSTVLSSCLYYILKLITGVVPNYRSGIFMVQTIYYYQIRYIPRVIWRKSTSKRFLRIWTCPVIKNSDKLKKYWNDNQRHDYYHNKILSGFFREIIKKNTQSDNQIWQYTGKVSRAIDFSTLPVIKWSIH